MSNVHVYPLPLSMNTSMCTINEIKPNNRYLTKPICEFSNASAKRIPPKCVCVCDDRSTIPIAAGCEHIFTI